MVGEPVNDPDAASRPALTSSAVGSEGRQAARRRLLNARGHLDAVVRMLEADRYCVDILYQLSAVEAAITRARRDILDGHIRGCVADALHDGVIALAEVADEVESAVFGGGAPAARTEKRAVR